MGTRAVFTFNDELGSHSVYKHWDGYPSGACEFIMNTFDYAWEWPRFEADEFAASFVAANKKSSGDIRLTSGPIAHGDLSYSYEIFKAKNGQMIIKCIGGGDDDFYGRFKDFLAKHGDDKLKARWNKMFPSTHPLNVESENDLLDSDDQEELDKNKIVDEVKAILAKYGMKV